MCEFIRSDIHRRGKLPRLKRLTHIAREPLRKKSNIFL